MLYLKSSRFHRRLAAVVAVAIVITMSAVFTVSPGSASAGTSAVGEQLRTVDPGHRCLDNDADTNGNTRTNVQLYDCRNRGPLG